MSNRNVGMGAAHPSVHTKASAWDQKLQKITQAKHAYQHEKSETNYAAVKAAINEASSISERAKAEKKQGHFAKVQDLVGVTTDEEREKRLNHEEDYLEAIHEQEDLHLKPHGVSASTNLNNNESAAHLLEQAQRFAPFYQTSWSNEKAKVKMAKESFIESLQEEKVVPTLQAWESALEHAKDYSQQLAEEEERVKSSNSLLTKTFNAVHHIGVDSLQKRQEFLTAERKLIEKHRWELLVRDSQRSKQKYELDANATNLAVWENSVKTLRDHHDQTERRELQPQVEKYFIGNEHIPQPHATVVEHETAYKAAKAKYDEDHSVLSRFVNSASDNSGKSTGCSWCCFWGSTSDDDDSKPNNLSAPLLVGNRKS